MADTPTQRAWQKTNTTHFGFRLQNSTDADIIAYLTRVKESGGSVQGEIKKALRMLIQANEKSAE